MSAVLIAAAPLYLSIGTGCFSLYLYFTSAYRLLSSRLIFMCFLVPFFLVIDSIVALIVLETPSFELVHTEYALQAVVRLSLNLLTAQILHPNTLSLFLARPAFDYQLQATFVWTLMLAATCTCILDITTSFVVIIPPVVSLITTILVLFTLALLFRVAVVSRKWHLTTSKSSWDLLVILQLASLAVSILRSWPSTVALNAASHFALFVWTTGSLLAISNLASPNLPKPITTTRRISHPTVSEDFQLNRDPFAGPHQHRHQISMMNDVYYYENDLTSHRKQGAIRTQYSSESSTRWLLPHPYIKSLPSLLAPVHLEQPTAMENGIPQSNATSVDTSLQIESKREMTPTVSRDRTPTQSLYAPDSPLKGALLTENEANALPNEDSFPSTSSFELDTPDQTFSSEVDVMQVDSSGSSHATLDDGNPMRPLSRHDNEMGDSKSVS